MKKGLTDTRKKDTAKRLQDSIRHVDQFDSRFYIRDDLKGKNWRPSVTYILGVGYPTPLHLQKWKADNGWDNAEAIKDKAADEGSQVHDIIDRLIVGETISTIDLPLKIKRCVQSFIDWFIEEQPQVLFNEYKTWAKEYAGTCDLLCKLKSDAYKETWLIDFKTGGIYDTGKAQVIAYKKADPFATRCAILQLGNKTKKRYTFSPIKREDEERYWNIFRTSLVMYKLLRPNDKPSEETFPAIFTLNPLGDAKEEKNQD